MYYAISINELKVARIETSVFKSSWSAGNFDEAEGNCQPATKSLHPSLPRAWTVKCRVKGQETSDLKLQKDFVNLLPQYDICDDGEDGLEQSGIGCLGSMLVFFISKTTYLL